MPVETGAHHEVPPGSTVIYGTDQPGVVAWVTPEAGAQGETGPVEDTDKAARERQIPEGGEQQGEGEHHGNRRHR